MAYLSPEEIHAAKQIDLLTYLQTNEPGELVRISSDSYCTREHDSLKISHGKWYWFSQKFGGRTALDYLIKVKGMSFPDAVRVLNGSSFKPKNLLLPEVDSNTEEVRQYLQGRGIHPTIIDYCIENKILFQTVDYKNVLFVAYDKNGKARYGALRATKGRYKGEASGSDKRYPFSIISNPNSDTVHVFESAIDLLSYATLQLYEGGDWRKLNMISLAGVFKPKREGVVPIALSSFLNTNPQIRVIHLHLDTDEVGRAAATGIGQGLKNYTVIDEPPDSGKDVNEYLQLRVGLADRKEDVFEDGC